MVRADDLGRVERPALSRRLAGALEGSALLVVAPAGFGKTMALEEALRMRQGTAAWVRCTESDGDSGRLLGHVVDALRFAVPGVADPLADRLAAGTEQVDVPVVLRALLAELRRLLVDPLAIVVDDAERLGGSPAALDLVAALFAAEVPRLCVAVATRRELPLRIERLRAHARLTEVGPAELAFSVEECAELLGPPGESDVEAVWAETEGWPLGVSLAARSRAGTGPAAGAEALARYLEEELLGALSARLRDAALDSSVPHEIDAALTAALGLPDGFVEELRGRGVPLRALPHDPDRLAYHPLVREILLARFERERPEERRREVHARVAVALEAAHDGPEAVEHWLRSGDAERAATAVAVHGQALANTAPDTVTGWLERLPAEARAAPALRLLAGRLAMGAGRFDEAIGPLREALDGFEAAGDGDAAWLARVTLADACAIKEDFEEVIPLADGLEESSSPVAPMVAIAAGAALAGVGRYADAAAMLASATSHPVGGSLAPLVAGFRGFWVDMMCGRLDDAAAGVREAIAMLERADLVNRLPYVIGFLAVIQEERGEHAAALAAMARAERVAEQNGAGGYVRQVAIRFRAGLDARAGRLAEAEAGLAAAGELTFGWFPGDSELTRATIAAARGEQAAAHEAAERVIGAGALVRWRSRWRTTALLAPVLVQAGRPTWATELLEEALAARPPLASCARLLALRAWLRSLEGDEAGAAEDVARAWEETAGAPEHLVRVERGRLEPLLWSGLARGVLEPEAVVGALEAAAPGGEALLRLVDHPLPAVRAAALRAAAASGHPDAPARVGELERDPDEQVAAAARAVRGRLVQEPPPLAFTLLGGFALRRGAYEVGDEAWGRRAAQRLVRYLLVQGGMAVPEEALFEAFWPGVETAAARRSLQVTVSSARAVLDARGAERSVLVVAERTYRLALGERDQVDAAEFERAAVAALAGGAPERVALLEAAAARWAGEPLPEDRYEDWTASWRERLIDLHRRVLGELAEARSQAGDTPGAVEAARRAVELDPLDEEAQQRLMLAYARAGRRGQALRQYLACRRALVDGLGIEPAEATTALQRRILAGEPV